MRYYKWILKNSFVTVTFTYRKTIESWFCGGDSIMDVCRLRPEAPESQIQSPTLPYHKLELSSILG